MTLYNNLSEEEKQIFNLLYNQVQQQAPLLVNKKTQQFLPKYTEKEQLVRLLIARKFDLEQTVEMWKKWVLWRVEYEIDTIQPESIKYEIESGKTFIHQSDKFGNTCIIIQLKHHDPQLSQIEDIMKLFFYFMERGINLSKTGRLCIIWDRNGIDQKKFDSRLIKLAKQLIGMFQDYYAERLFAVYVLYPNWFMKFTYNLIKPFIADKVQKKIKIINNMDDLDQYFDRSQLLKEHGGNSEYLFNPNDNIIPIDNINISQYPECYKITQYIDLGDNIQYQLEKNNIDNNNNQQKNKEDNESIHENDINNQNSNNYDDDLVSFYTIINNEIEFFDQYQPDLQKATTDQISQVQIKNLQIIKENQQINNNKSYFCGQGLCNEGDSNQNNIDNDKKYIISSSGTYKQQKEQLENQNEDNACQIF